MSSKPRGRPPSPRNRRRRAWPPLFRIVAAGSIVVAAALAGLLVHRARVEARMAQALSAIAAFQLEEAETHLLAARGALGGAGARVDAGLALVAVARGASDAASEDAVVTG